MSKVIICIDDEDIILRSLEQDLYRVCDEDYFVEYAQSAIEAYEVIEELSDEGHEIALIISDYIMPYEKGDKFLVEMDKNYPNALKIMLTGQAGIDAIANVINNANLYRYIAKPWNRVDLRMTVKEALLSFSQKKEIDLYHLKLENRVKEKTKALEDINKNLEERIKIEVEKYKRQQDLLIQQSKLAQMGEMMNIITHQWKQPLASLSLLNQEMMIAFELGKLTNEYVDNLITKSDRNIQFMSGTIDHFRNFFNPNKQKESFSIDSSINKVVLMLTQSFKLYSIAIEIDKSGIEIFNYRNEFEQVVLSILNNAKDALISREIEDGFIKIGIKTINEKLEIAIEDNAGGVDKNIIENIFDSYFTTKEDGSGIGLYMVKMILRESMQGEIFVENSKIGASFKILLDLKE